jgi:hypothetical protein
LFVCVLGPSKNPLAEEVRSAADGFESTVMMLW